MRKLRIDDLALESFTTGAPLPRRGTVAANQDPLTRCTGSATGCVTNESMAELTCGGDAETDFCGTADGSNCCHPYDISLDWTFCETECCNSNVYTCYQICTG